MIPYQKVESDFAPSKGSYWVIFGSNEEYLIHYDKGSIFDSGPKTVYGPIPTPDAARAQFEAFKAAVRRCYDCLYCDGYGKVQVRSECKKCSGRGIIFPASA